MQWIRDGQCLNTALLAGTEISGDLGQSALLVSVPQAYLEYTDSEWDPPSRWDDGIHGLIADYSINAQTRHENGVMTLTTSAVMVRSALTLGRGAYELTGRAIISIPAVTMTATLTIAVRKNWEWSRYYARRALPSLKPNFRWAKIISTPIFLMASVTLAAASVPMIKCYRQTCAATPRYFRCCTHYR